jgi:CHAT domain-containing protein/tetratricopeptide (TPR) repeat protein
VLVVPLVLALLAAAPATTRLDRARAAEARGDYGAMANEAGAAVTESRERGDVRAEAEALNLAGAAYLYRGDYQAALVDFQSSLALLRAIGDIRQSAVRLNNIGGLQFFQGQYQKAWQSYTEAARLIDEHRTEDWTRDARQLVLTGQAALLQRLGRDNAAMAIYRGLLSASLAMPPADQARLRANAGTLYRRLGDPVKARQQYRLALDILAREPHADTRLGVLKNMAIAEALEFGDLAAARALFTQVLASARASGNRRETVQALLYLGETEYRGGDLPSATAHWGEAASLAAPEERWKALYGLARVAPPQRAAAHLEEAVAIIESLRAGLSQSDLRTEFLADKRDVYDARIELLLDQPQPSPQVVLEWIERTRARSQEQGRPLEPDAGSAILSFWSSQTRWAWVWKTKSAMGVVHGVLPPRAASRLSELARRLADPSSQEWRREAAFWSAELLTLLPVFQQTSLKRLIVVPDLLLAGVPLEPLPVPGSDRLLLEQFEVSYLPSSRLSARASSPRRIWPWTPSVLAIGAVKDSTVPLPGDERWIELPRTAAELQAVAREMPGRAEIREGSAARKQAITGGWPILHIATHGEADLEDPRRSRLLFAGPEYLFVDEAARLPLAGVDLVTLSACETARGRLIRGEGVDSFARAFLRAGSATAVASLWSVEDAAAAEFMRQFYHQLAQGEGKAAALRAAKLKLLRSGTRLARPAHWAAFVLYGDAESPAVPRLPWAAVAVAAALLILVAALILRRPPARG